MSNELLDKLAKKFSKKYGSLSVASNIEDSTDYISTGNYALDLCLNGGVSFGYACELSGFSGSGKTTLLQVMLADAQRRYGAFGIWLDRENAWFNERAEQLGVDTNNVIVVKPQDIVTVDDATMVLSDIMPSIDKDKYLFISIDSISAFAKEGDKADMGKKAQGIHNLFRKMTGFMNNKVSLCFTNQRTYKVGVLFGDNTTVTSGEGSKYYSTYRLQLEDRKVIKDPDSGNEVIGNWIDCLVIKTRRGPNYRRVTFPFFFKGGTPYYGGYARLLADRGYLKPKNKQEFKSLKRNDLTYNEEEVNEFEIESFLNLHPELKFDKYPIYNVDTDDNEEELWMLDGDDK